MSALVTTGNAFDPECPQTASSYFKPIFIIDSCSTLYFWLLWHEFTIQKWPALNPSWQRPGRETDTNKPMVNTGSCWKPQQLSGVIPAGTGGTLWQGRMEAQPMALPPQPVAPQSLARADWERAAQHPSPSSLQQPNKPYLEPHDSSEVSRDSLFICSWSIKPNRRSGDYLKLVFSAIHNRIKLA